MSKYLKVEHLSPTHHRQALTTGHRWCIAGRVCALLGLSPFAFFIAYLWQHWGFWSWSFWQFWWVHPPSHPGCGWQCLQSAEEREEAKGTKLKVGCSSVDAEAYWRCINSTEPSPDSFSSSSFYSACYSCNLSQHMEPLHHLNSKIKYFSCTGTHSTL